MNWLRVVSVCSGRNSHTVMNSSWGARLFEISYDPELGMLAWASTDMRTEEVYSHAQAVIVGKGMSSLHNCRFTDMGNIVGLEVETNNLNLEMLAQLILLKEKYELSEHSV